MKKQRGSDHDRKWILETGIPIVQENAGEITLRKLHYKLVGKGMPNDVHHYKKVIAAMIEARWDKKVGFDAFLDHERETIGSTNYRETNVEDNVDLAKEQIREWATSYSKNTWENQPNYVEVFIEKKTMQGAFERPCYKHGVALNPCKGYPSLTFQYDAMVRFRAAARAGKNCKVLYFGDYDPSGEDIPRSIEDTIGRMGVKIEVIRVALMEEQVLKWKLPPAPTKITDTRSVQWEGIGQVELEAVEDSDLRNLLDKAMAKVFDPTLHMELLEQQKHEKREFLEIIRRDFDTLLDE